MLPQTKRQGQTVLVQLQKVQERDRDHKSTQDNQDSEGWSPDEVHPIAVDVDER